MTPDEGQLPEKVTLPAGSGEQGRAEALLANLWQKHIDGDSAVITDRAGAIAILTAALRAERVQALEEAKYPAIHLCTLGNGKIEVRIEVDKQWITVIRESGDIISHIVEPGGIAKALREQARRAGED